MAAQLLSGRIACVTGAASGIGAAVSSLMETQGATVIRADIDKAALELANRPGSVVCDVSDEAAVSSMVDSIVNDHGRLDIVVSNAGVLGQVGPLVDSSTTEWLSVMAVNLTGTYLVTKHAGRAIAASGGGAIVTTASVMGARPAAGCGAYAASNAAIISLTRSLAVELRCTNIRANTVLPGFIDTPMVRDHDFGLKLGLGELDDTIAQLQGRFGTTDDVANLVLFLASDRASYLTGGAYTVDGGLSENVF